MFPDVDSQAYRDGAAKAVESLSKIPSGWSAPLAKKYGYAPGNVLQGEAELVRDLETEMIPDRAEIQAQLSEKHSGVPDPEIQAMTRDYYQGYRMAVRAAFIQDVAKTTTR